MLFTETWQLVLSGKKTQTRRIVKSGELRSADAQEVVNHNWRVKWRVGKTYAVQPGRGEKAIGRIKITRIRQELLQSISIEDAKAEGFEVGDPAIYADVYDFIKAWESINTRKGTRWVDNPRVWVIEFELVKGK